MKELVFVLRSEDIDTLGAVRCIPGLRVAKGQGELWLRGIYSLDNADIKIKKLPAFARYILDHQDYLFPIGKNTPVGKLKELQWIPVAEFIPLELPVSALPARPEEKHPVQLVRTKHAIQGEALLTSLYVWKAYAHTAPAARLERLRFAVSENKDVLISGSPLPPIPGQEFWRSGTMLLPSGYSFEFPFAAALIENRLNPNKDSQLVFHVSGEWEKILFSSFVPATRSAVRLTMEEAQNE